MMNMQHHEHTKQWRKIWDLLGILLLVRGATAQLIPCAPEEAAQSVRAFTGEPELRLIFRRIREMADPPQQRLYELTDGRRVFEVEPYTGLVRTWNYEYVALWSDEEGSKADVPASAEQFVAIARAFLAEHYPTVEPPFTSPEWQVKTSPLPPKGQLPHTVDVNFQYPITNAAGERVLNRVALVGVHAQSGKVSYGGVSLPRLRPNVNVDGSISHDQAPAVVVAALLSDPEVEGVRLCDLNGPGVMIDSLGLQRLIWVATADTYGDPKRRPDKRIWWGTKEMPIGCTVYVDAHSGELLRRIEADGSFTLETSLENTPWQRREKPAVPPPHASLFWDDEKMVTYYPPRVQGDEAWLYVGRTENYITLTF